MSKNYDLYPASERKIDNWRRRILGYEKMKRDLQRQIKILKNKNKKQQLMIDKAIKLLNAYIGVLDDTSDLYFENVKSILEAAKEKWEYE